MNTIDVGRNELARLGLHPGARHPNVVDSTPVQDEDSTIFTTTGRSTGQPSSKRAKPAVSSKQPYTIPRQLMTNRRSPWPGR